MKSAEIKQLAVVAIPLLTVIGFIEDLNTRQGVDDWVWYFVALAVTVFVNKRFLPLALVPVFTVLTLIGYYLSPPGREGNLALVNCLMGVGVLWITAVILYYRQRVELALRKSETHYRFLFKNMQIGFAHCKMVYQGEKPVNFIYLSVNPAFHQITGLTGVVGRRVTEVIPGIKDMHPELFEIYGKVASSGRPKKFEYFLKPSKIWLSVSAYSPAKGFFVTTFENITERKHAESSLTLFRALIDRSSDGIAIVNPETGFFCDVNETYCRILGYSREKLLSMRVPDVDTTVKPSAWAGMVGDLRQRRAIVVDGRLKRKDGTTFPAEVNIRWVELEREYIVAVVRDVTERKKAERELRKLSTAVEQSPVSIMITNQAGNIEYVNPKFSEMTGYAAEEVIGKNPSLLKSGEMPPEGYKQLWKTITAGGTWHGEFHNRKKNGELYWELAAISPILDSSARITHFLGVKEDITEHKRVHEELTAQTAFLEAQVESTLDGILVVNREAKIILRNKRFDEIFRVPEHIIEGGDDAKARDWVTNRVKDREQFAARINHLYANPDEMGRDEIALIDETILDRYSAPVKDKNGKNYGRIWVFRDITERRKLEAQFLQSQKMEGIGQLAGGVAHDFNNILAIIQMQAGLLKNSSLSDKQSEFTDEIGSTVQRAAALTRQLLLFSRREVFQPRDMDLSESVAATTKMLKRIVRESVQIEIKLAPQPMSVHADPGMMDQVLMNLTVNARDAMPDAGRLMIETSVVEFSETNVCKSPQGRPGTFVCLSVSDTGTGIAPEVLPKIFEPFFTTKEVGKGTGLGLATVFGIMQQHQGWVDVESEVGRGSSFRIYLPRLPLNTAKKITSPALKDLRGGSETILLAEDDPALRISVRKALAQLGYRILEAPTGVKALEVWKENRNEIGLLLTDMVMPGGMSGKELGQILLQENPQLKVIYMSGYSTEVAGNDFPLREGVNFLAKPFKAAKLAETIRNNLDQALKPAKDLQ